MSRSSLLAPGDLFATARILSLRDRLVVEIGGDSYEYARAHGRDDLLNKVRDAFRWYVERPESDQHQMHVTLRDADSGERGEYAATLWFEPGHTKTPLTDGAWRTFGCTLSTTQARPLR